MQRLLMTQTLRHRLLPSIVLALAIVPVIASCGQTSNGIAPEAGAPTTASPTAPPAWVNVPHFASANGGSFFASLSVPPGWTYVPASSPNLSDALMSPHGALHMGGPTALSSGETCSDYVQTDQIAGFGLKPAGTEPITVGGLQTTEAWYSGSPSGSPETLYSIAVESDLVGCLGIEALTGSTPVDHQTMDHLFSSIVFHPSH